MVMMIEVQGQVEENGSGKFANLIKILLSFLMLLPLGASVQAQATYEIYAKSGPGGSINPAGITKVVSGAEQIFTFSPLAGYVVSDVIVDGFSLGPMEFYSFPCVTDSHIIVVVFKKETELYLPPAAGDDQIHTTGVPPMVLLVMGRDHRLYYEAYNDASDLNGNGRLDVGYNPNIEYYGYFDSYKVYTYNTLKSRFEPLRYTSNKKVNPVATDEWSGDFLNYLTMSRIDLLRKALYGGYRSIDTPTETELMRSYIPQDAHSWGKEYESIDRDGYDIVDYTPLETPPGGRRHLFANTTLANATGQPELDKPRLRVLTNSPYRIWEWVSIKRPVAGLRCEDGETGPLCEEEASNGFPASVMSDYLVRVLVGDSDKPDPNCKKYPAGNYKPIGLLQRFGESGDMLFGLLTGSYEKNLSGGVLRKRIGLITDEINLDTGQFKSDVTGIIKTIDKFRIYQFSYSNYEYGAWPEAWLTTGPMTRDGQFPDWGNPVAEMMYEGLRYLAGEQSCTPAFDYSGGIDSILGLPKVGCNDWDDPLAVDSSRACAKSFMLVISDLNPNYDSQYLPGVNSNFGPGLGNPLISYDGTSFQAQSIANMISDFEFEGKLGNHYLGQVEGIYDGSCTPKDTGRAGFGDIRGLCPEEPTKQGSYYSVAVAHFGRAYQIGAENRSVLTYVVAMSFPRPKIEIQVGDNMVTLVPFGKSVGGCLGLDPEGLFQPTNTMVDFYVQSLTPTSGSFRINFEDVEQGADHDLDAIVLYRYQALDNDNNPVVDPALGTRVQITLESEYAAGCIIQHLGYIISGTTEDGTYLEVRDKETSVADDVDYFLDTPPSGYRVSGIKGLPLIATRIFTPSGIPAANLLRDPLWYAAKWGGFNDLDGNGIPNLQSEWDKTGDGVPDNYYYVTNLLELEESLNQSFRDIISRGVSYVTPVVSVDEINRTQSGDQLYLTLFKPIDSDHWQGNIKKYGLDLRAREDCGREDPEWTVVDKNDLTATNCDGNFKSASMSFWSMESDGGFVDKGGVGEVMLINQMPTNAQVEKALLTVDQFHGFRNIYTYKTDSKADGSFTPFKRSVITGSDLEVLNDSLRDRIINFVYGYTFDTREVAGVPGYPVKKRDWILGDIIHSEPRLIDYFDTNGNLDYRFIAAGANDGMLHVFTDREITLNGQYYPAGAEILAFIPGDLLPRLAMFGDPTLHPFMVDGSPNLFRASTKIAENGRYDGYAHKTLVFGQRRGGRSYWALDVSKPDPSQWKVKWHLQGGWKGLTTPLTREIEELGYTWGKPFGATLKIGEDDFRDVMIFAGGYDPREDGFPEGFADANNNGIRDVGEVHAVTPGGTEDYDLYNPGENVMGRGIFVVDLADGEILFKATWADKESEMTVGLNQLYSQMKFCFPADMSVIPLSETELIIYAADIYAQIWKVSYRYKAQPQKSYFAADSNKWTVKLIFAANPGSDMPSGNPDWFLGENGQGPPGYNIADQGRKTFYSPDVSYWGNEWTTRPVLYFGTGDRAHPRYRMVKNRFYVVADYDQMTDETHLLNLTCGELNEGADADGNGVVDEEDAWIKSRLIGLLENGSARGFYRILCDQGNCIDDPTDHAGQHVLSQPTLFFKNVYFASYQPVFDDPCHPTGKAFVYALDYSFGAAVFDHDENNGNIMTVSDSCLKISGSSIPSGVRIIPRRGSAAGFISVGGAVSGVGETQTTTVPSPPGGVSQLIWETGD